MSTEAEQLLQRYGSMDTEELIELSQRIALTPIASAALKQILEERGVSEAMRNQLSEQLADEARLETVPLGLRLGARLIDYAIIVAVLTLSTVVLTIPLISWLSLISVFLYVLTADALPNGQGIGKRLFRIAVVNEATRRPCTIDKSIARNWLFLIPGLTTIDCLFLLRKDRRRLGDIFAHTIVVSAGVNGNAKIEAKSEQVRSKGREEE